MAFLNRGVTLKALLENPELLNPQKIIVDDKKDSFGEKKDPNEAHVTRPNQSAFLGPQLWDKTLPYDLMSGDFKDLKLEYMDLDEFFNENDQNSIDEELNHLVDVSVVTGVPTPPPNKPSPAHLQHAPPPSPPQEISGPRLLQNLLAPSPPAAFKDSMPSPGSVVGIDPAQLFSVHSPVDTHRNRSPPPGHSPSPGVLQGDRDGGTKRQWSPNSTRLELADSIDIEAGEVALATVPGEDEFDPKRRRFSVDELRPQPVIKKSKKVFVPDAMKDDRYWSRRTKNNVAAKRSRDARRVKENQIALRAAFLEKENEKLVAELAKMSEKCNRLQARLNKYEPPTSP